jgi:hypothetical protein
LSGGEKVVFPNIYSFGSACLTPAKEYKNYTSFKRYSGIIGNNIIIQALGNTVRHDLKFKTIPNKIPAVVAIYTGTKKHLLNE